MIRSCPDCYGSWAKKEGRIAGWLLWTGARKLARLNGLRHYRILHCVVSMKYDGSSLDTLRVEVYRIAKAHGITGGPCVFHPYRKNEDGHYVPDGYVHFHIVGLAFGDVKFGSRGMGYVFKVIEDRRRGGFGGLRSWGEVSRLLAYLLTHTGVEDGRHAVTWFGALKDRRVVKKVLVVDFAEGWLALTRHVKPECPECGSRDTWSVDETEYFHKPECSETGHLSSVEIERLEALRADRLREVGKVVV